jgi:hypothetical protein
MKGLWKEKVSGFSRKGDKRKKFTKKHHIKDNIKALYNQYHRTDNSKRFIPMYNKNKNSILVKTYTIETPEKAIWLIKYTPRVTTKLRKQKTVEVLVKYVQIGKRSIERYPIYIKTSDGKNLQPHQYEKLDFIKKFEVVKPKVTTKEKYVVTNSLSNHTMLYGKYLNSNWSYEYGFWCSRVKKFYQKYEHHKERANIKNWVKKEDWDTVPKDKNLNRNINWIIW